MNPPDLPKRRFAVVEDQAAYRHALIENLTQRCGWECVAACSSYHQAMAEIPAKAPDLVLMDIRLENPGGGDGLSGLNLVPKLRVRLPSTSLVMLTVVDDTDDILQAIQDGAHGYILKGGTPEELAEQLAVVLEGGASMSPAIARKLTEWFQSHRPTTKSEVQGYGLTEREWEILGLTARGQSHARIAETLGISRFTVRNHFQNIYTKFRVNDPAPIIYQLAPVLRIREALRGKRKPPE
ncbi:MAG: response regulator transcription factor [Verrucomicrobiales bacterium]|nr:response regulator transcription factor [Verrucomicrobiales bacterium]